METPALVATVATLMPRLLKAANNQPYWGSAYAPVAAAPIPAKAHRLRSIQRMPRPWPARSSRSTAFSICC